MITLGRAEERGHANHGWLESYQVWEVRKCFYSILRDQEEIKFQEKPRT